jgi:WD40 repeat protein
LAWLAHHGCVSALAFDSDGKRLFSAGEDKLVRAFSVEPGRVLGAAGRSAAERSCDVGAVAGDEPDGRFVASGSDDGTILLWDQKTGELLGPPLREHQRAVMALGYSPDSKLLLSGSDDQTVRLWDAKAARRLQLLTGAQKTVRAVAFVGKLAAAGDWDGHLLLWDTQSGKLQGKPQKGDIGLSVSGLVATRSRVQFLFSSSWDGDDSQVAARDGAARWSHRFSLGREHCRRYSCRRMDSRCGPAPRRVGCSRFRSRSARRWSARPTFSIVSCRASR